MNYNLVVNLADSQGHPPRNSILASHRKRRGLELLLEELTRPEIDIPMISKHTSNAIAKIKQNNVMIIPQLLYQLQKQNEPLILEISGRARPEDNNKPCQGHSKTLSHTIKKSHRQRRRVKGGSSIYPLRTETVVLPDVHQTTEESTGYIKLETHPTPEEFNETSIETTDGFCGMGASTTPEVAPEEKHFEIIFSNSLRPIDADWDGQIIHSTTESTDATVHPAGSVNVPSSFPLFQLVHTGEVPEEVLHEIVRLIRQANPQLDLNSITFQFKSPQTVDIIANVNS